jgi:hypothetical protein
VNLPSNCLIYATWRWLCRGGYLILRRSRSGPFPHFMWAPQIPADLPVEQLVPHQRRDRLLPPPLFHGHEELIAEPEGPLPARKPGFDWALFLFWAGYFGLVSALYYWAGAIAYAWFAS